LIHKYAEGKGMNTLAFGLVQDKSPLAMAKASSLGVLAVTLIII